MLDFLIIGWLVGMFSSKKKEPIDYSKTSDYYIKKYDLLDAEPIEPTKPKEPQIVINITHNHLHIHTTKEDNPYHQDQQ